MKKNLFLLALIPALSACTQPLSVPFDTDPMILRGTWSGSEFVEGTNTGRTLRLELKATYDTRDQYAVSGVGTLGGEALSVTGKVSGSGVTRFIQPQYTPAPKPGSVGAVLTLARPGGDALRLSCEVWNIQATDVWSCSTLGLVEPATYDLVKVSP